MLLNDFTTQDGTRILVGRLPDKWEDILVLFPQPQLFADELISRKTEQRKKELLGSRYLLYKALGKQSKVSYTPEGKPYLNMQDAHISISHSKDYVCVAIHPEHEVGIDIECIGTKMKRVKERFLHPTELHDLQSDTDCLKAHLYWSGKEAIYKIAGKDAVDFRASIHIKPFEISDQYATAHATANNEAYTIECWVNADCVMTKANKK